jgi:hypothetical protein
MFYVKSLILDAIFAIFFIHVPAYNDIIFLIYDNIDCGFLYVIINIVYSDIRYR